MNAWDDPQAALYYEAFCHAHARYTEANEALIAHACIEADMALLDVAAGTGRTAETALRSLGETGRIRCIEPSEPMRLQGMRRLEDARVEWSGGWPSEADGFDRILCGAAIWQLQPLSQTFADLAQLLRPGGALCFNIPAAYLLEPDEPGGGTDPSLLALPTLLMAMGDGACADGSASTGTEAAMPSSASMEAMLAAAGLRAESWQFRLVLTQQAYADWLKIPATSDRLLTGLTPEQRAQRIDTALRSVDHSSWKWERWYGWTAWKH